MDYVYIIIANDGVFGVYRSKDVAKKLFENYAKLSDAKIEHYTDGSYDSFFTAHNEVWKLEEHMVY